MNRRTFDRSSQTHPAVTHCDDHELHMRVADEFDDMPGLRLTLPQATRLFGLDPGRCERVLNALVALGVLVTDGQAFGRAGVGRWSA